MALDYSSLDIRQVSAISGVMAAGISADSEIVQVRFTTSTSQRLAILSARLSAANLGTAFTAGAIQFSLTKASGWSAAGTGGGTLDLTGVNGKLNNTISGQVMPEIRVATTAALTAGTKTLDSVRTGNIFAGVPNVAGSQIVNDALLFSDAVPGLQPIYLGNQEGVVLRVTAPATGTWSFALNLAFAIVS
jgi:hypothetical protein